jgi:hypothetical protein
VSATTFSGKLLVLPSWTYQSTGASTVSQTFGKLYEWDHTNGHATNQMDRLFVERVALAGSGSRTVNLATGVAGAITSTAAQVMAAIVASAAASALVTVDDTGASTGAAAGGRTPCSACRTGGTPHGRRRALAPAPPACPSPGSIRKHRTQSPCSAPCSLVTFLHASGVVRPPLCCAQEGYPDAPFLINCHPQIIPRCPKNKDIAPVAHLCHTRLQRGGKE